PPQARWPSSSSPSSLRGSWARKSRARRLASLALLAAVGALVLAVPALGDADPASDVLYTSTVFYSYDQLPSNAAQARLNETVKRATKAGFPIRVALIAKAPDLGGVIALWGEPHQYARFLGLELGFVYKGSLLVVMPAGLGYSTNGKSSPAGTRSFDRCDSERRTTRRRTRRWRRSRGSLLTPDAR